MAPIISTSRGEYSSVDEYFRSLPCGYRFCPTDDELVEHYLMRKVLNQPLPLNRLHDVYIYDYHPKDLTAKYSLIRESDWFFFTATKRKYPRGGRPSRTAKNLGHWKATGKKYVIQDARGNEIGSKRTLEFLEGDKRKEATKTDWKMHEYKLKKDIAPPNKIGHGNNKLDDCVLVKIYQSSNAKEKDDNKANAESTIESNQAVEHLSPPMPPLKNRRGMPTSTTSEIPVINPNPFDQHSFQNGTCAYHPGQINYFYNQNYQLYNMGMTSFANEYPLPDSIGMGTGLLTESVPQVPLVDSSSVQLPAHVREYENSSFEVGSCSGTTTTAKEGSDGDFMTLEELEYFYCDGLQPDQFQNKISS